MKFLFLSIFGRLKTTQKMGISLNQLFVNFALPRGAMGLSAVCDCGIS